VVVLIDSLLNDHHMAVMTAVLTSNMADLIDQVTFHEILFAIASVNLLLGIAVEVVLLKADLVFHLTIAIAANQDGVLRTVHVTLSIHVILESFQILETFGIIQIEDHHALHETL
jgi:hypothetical protein